MYDYYYPGLRQLLCMQYLILGNMTPGRYFWIRVFSWWPKKSQQIGKFMFIDVPFNL